MLGNYLGLAYAWAGGVGTRFALYYRLPGILADLAVVLILLHLRRRIGRPSWWALGLLAASPVSFMVSGYHGNYVIPCWPSASRWRQPPAFTQPALCGVFLGLTYRVENHPIPLAPAFFFYWWHRGRSRAFFVATAANS